MKNRLNICKKALEHSKELNNQIKNKTLILTPEDIRPARKSWFDLHKEYLHKKQVGTPTKPDKCDECGAEMKNMGETELAERVYDVYKCAGCENGLAVRR